MSDLLSLRPVLTLAGSVCLKMSDSIESDFIEVVYMGECFMVCII